MSDITVLINGKEYTQDEIEAIRHYLRDREIMDEAEEILHDIMEDDIDTDPDFVQWLGVNKRDILAKIADMIEQRDFFSNLADESVNLDPYAEVLHRCFDMDMVY